MQYQDVTPSAVGKITTSQTLKNKIDKLTDMIKFGEFPSLFLESPSVVTSIQLCMLSLLRKHKTRVFVFPGSQL